MKTTFKMRQAIKRLEKKFTVVSKEFNVDEELRRLSRAPRGYYDFCVLKIKGTRYNTAFVWRDGQFNVY